MKLTKYAQSTLKIEYNGENLLIDPGNYNFEPDKIKREDFSNVSVLIVTHKHADHFDLAAVEAIYTSSKPVIFSTQEIVNTLKSAGVPAEMLSVGQTVEHRGFIVTATRADHVVKGENIDVFGVVVNAEGKRIYHASDTTYFEDKPKNIDVAFVPINNRGVAMNFDDAFKFIREMAPKIAIPVHYDSPKDAHINPQDWVDLFANEEVESRVMSFGEILEI